MVDAIILLIAYLFSGA